jgi:hypothetical protein
MLFVEPSSAEKNLPARPRDRTEYPTTIVPCVAFQKLVKFAPVIEAMSAVRVTATVVVAM